MKDEDHAQVCCRDRLKSIAGFSARLTGPRRLAEGKGAREKANCHQSAPRSAGWSSSSAILRDQSGLSILDMGGACQENINFITNLGHRITPRVSSVGVDETFRRRLRDGPGTNPHQIESSSRPIWTSSRTL